ncbi:MAG TPA: hypothetical protein VEL51_09100 [Vicinamibacterales bacterium]|nr:hypothetical protein [Vicinamibacterales bacterium]
MSPKDLDWRACYVMLDAGGATFHRVPYDVATAAAAIRATELPLEFASDIETGGAPRASTGSNYAATQDN